jgi:hypothetical protein
MKYPLLFSLFTLVIMFSLHPAQAQEGILQKELIPYPGNAMWSPDSQQLVYFGTHSVSSARVNMPEEAWAALDVRSRRVHYASRWQLQPELSEEEQALLTPAVNRDGDVSFMYESPSGAYIVCLCGGISIYSRAQQQIAHTNYTVYDPYTGPEWFSVMWSADESAFVFSMYGEQGDLSTGYVFNYTENVESSVVLPVEQEIKGKNFNFLSFDFRDSTEKAHDISDDGRWVVFAARHDDLTILDADDLDYYLVVWDTRNADNSYLITDFDVESILAASFRGASESELLIVNAEGLLRYDLRTQTKTVLLSNLMIAARAIFSPDSRYLALISDYQLDTSNFQLQILDLYQMDNLQDSRINLQTPQPTPNDPPSFAPDYYFTPGEQAMVRTPPGDNLRLRAEPDAKSEMIVNMSNGLVITVLDGPESLIILDENGYTAGHEYWWKVELSSGTEGWALGTRNGTDFLVPLPKEGEGSYTCENAPEPRLKIGEQGQVLADAVVVLYTSPDATEFIAELAGREVFEVVDGVECGISNNYMWQVKYGDEIGWMVETDNVPDYRYVAVPLSEADENTGCPDEGLWQRLEVGGQAKVIAEEPVNVRTRPTLTGTDMFLLYKDEIVTITEGPLCYPVNGTTRSWWRVENERGVTGWVAEGDERHDWIDKYDASLATPTPTLDASCILTTLSGVNLRSGAGGEFERVGSAGANMPLGADGQVLAADGTLWWRLIDGQGWVAASLVSESEGCDRLPIIDATPTANPATPNGNVTATSAMTLTPTVAATPTLNPNATCILTTLQGVNFRAQPDTNGEKIGSALANTALEADGQIAGIDGFIWWRLVDGQGWVRQDLVSESEGCTSLPVVE